MIRIGQGKDGPSDEKQVINRQDKDIKNVAAENISDGQIYGIDFYCSDADHQLRLRGGQGDKGVAYKSLTQTG